MPIKEKKEKILLRKFIKLKNEKQISFKILPNTRSYSVKITNITLVRVKLNLDALCAPNIESTFITIIRRRKKCFTRQARMDFYTFGYLKIIL